MFEPYTPSRNERDELLRGVHFHFHLTQNLSTSHFVSRENLSFPHASDTFATFDSCLAQKMK